VTTAVAIRHTFETAHRLPQLGGKCENLHGHSWACHIVVSAPEAHRGVVVDFGAFKRAIRQWIDAHLDHGTMLGADDLLVLPLLSQRCRVFRFGAADAVDAEKLAADLAWPTVENVATLLGRMALAAIDSLEAAPGATVARVRVDETSVNTAFWTPTTTEGNGAR
jgi:6-pyruvoyltetrahydropterin/6-carboxytetrahydropterin synthase